MKELVVVDPAVVNPGIDVVEGLFGVKQILATSFREFTSTALYLQRTVPCNVSYPSGTRLTLTPHGCCASAATESTINALHRAERSFSASKKIEHMGKSPKLLNNENKS